MILSNNWLTCKGIDSTIIAMRKKWFIFQMMMIANKTVLLLECSVCLQHNLMFSSDRQSCRARIGFLLLNLLYRLSYCQINVSHLIFSFFNGLHAKNVHKFCTVLFDNPQWIRRNRLNQQSFLGGGACSLFCIVRPVL